MSLVLLFHYLLLNMFRMLIHPSSGACDLFYIIFILTLIYTYFILYLFHVLYCSGSMCVGVTVWFGWGGVVSLCRLKHCFSLLKDTTLRCVVGCEQCSHPTRQPPITATTHIQQNQSNTPNAVTGLLFS